MPGLVLRQGKETKLLISHIKNRNNVTLFVLRRMGKTGTGRAEKRLKVRMRNLF